MTVWAYSSPSLGARGWAPEMPMPPKPNAYKWSGRPVIDEAQAMAAVALPRGTEEAHAAQPAPDGQSNRMDDLLSKTLSRLQLGPGGERCPERPPQRQPVRRSSRAGAGQSPTEPSAAEQTGADPLRGWAQKVLATGPSATERRQDLFDIVDTALESKKYSSEQDSRDTPTTTTTTQRRSLLRRASTRTGSSVSVGAGHRAPSRQATSRNHSKMGASQRARFGRGLRLSSASISSEDEQRTSQPLDRTAGGSSPSAPPTSPFKRSTREVLQERADAEVAEVFARFAVDFEIQSSDLFEAIATLGHRRTRRDWVEEILQKSFFNRSYLDKGEFEEFAEIYRKRFLDEMGERYRTSDLYNQGSITMSDLSTLLRREDITPLPGMVRELFTEIAAGSGAALGSTAGSGGTTGPGLGFEEYLRVYDLVIERMGFTRAALARLRTAFARFAGSPEGRLGRRALRAALHWLGLAAYVDEDGIERNEAEFLQLVSQCHEREVVAVNTAFSGRDRRLIGSVSIRDLPAVFEDLGYMAVTPQVCKEACAACNSQDAAAQPLKSQGSLESSQMHVRRAVSGWGRASRSSLGESNNNLSLVQVMDTPRGSSASLQWRNIPKDLLWEDFYAVLDQVRDTHCLSCTERMEAAEAFEVHASSKARGMSLVEMARAVRWLGYPKHLGRLLEIFDESDLYDTYRRRDSQEFLRLVARLREDEVCSVRKRLKKGPLKCTCGLSDGEEEENLGCDRCTAEIAGCCLLQAGAFGVLLGDLGHSASWEQVSRLQDAAGGSRAHVPLWDALQLLDQHRQAERGSVRKNEGFSDTEVRRFQQRFQRLEGGAQGTVKRRELAKVVEDLVGRKRRCKRLSAIAREVLLRMDPTISSEASDSSHNRPRLNSSNLLAQSHAEADFQELLRVMRALLDQDDEERLERERDIVAVLDFSREEIRDFRRLFHEASMDAEKRLLLPELERLVTRVLPATRGMQEDLKALVTSAAGISEEEALDFGSFLAVMKQLLQQNWRNINEATETLLAGGTKAHG